MASYCARHPLPGGGDVLPLVRERLRGVGLPRRCEDSRGGGGDGKAVGPEVVAVGVGPAAGGAEAGQDLGGSAGSDMVVVSREDANDDAADGGGAKEPEEGKEQQQAAPQKKGFPWSLVPTKRIGRRVRMAARQHPPRRPPEIGPRPVVLFPMDAGADPFPEPVVVADPLVKPTKSAERRRFSVHF
ncbi:uncharacterized protein THITE_2107800 [Thermothielavioides terrestris NRRL 8126]|uniref:Uncharacterized protein n=1 Tax=Thermothielavioides terrestris (strain ATCC 38088 / NRRL 8126) TaxID=578455 RepID=G2QV85_THETT|nr:uncharacterized protein THITE_2107800 [Thermothielavioides terrestris NRRL 8126]AEO62972.1 hypothetical protein THITE_2107800 [Thermothielavioides terrestris NRRL 8126]